MDWDPKLGTFNQDAVSGTQNKGPRNQTQMQRPEILDRRRRTKKPEPVPEICNQTFILHQECFT